jgi:anion-transporting  ArsA/GET3 family ATPase
VFFRALGGLVDGFRERASGVKKLLGDPATTFLIITSPEREPADEAIFFREKLREAGMPFGGLIVNRVQLDLVEGDADEIAGELEDELGADLVAKVADTLHELQVLAVRDLASLTRLMDELEVEDPTVIPLLEGDVHDVDGLAQVHHHLFA